jgi:hypothetical protein
MFSSVSYGIGQVEGLQLCVRPAIAQHQGTQSNPLKRKGPRGNGECHASLFRTYLPFLIASNERQTIQQLSALLDFEFDVYLGVECGASTGLGKRSGSTGSPRHYLGRPDYFCAFRPRLPGGK